MDKNTLALTAGKANTIKGTITRTAPFASPVTLTLAGLPGGYKSEEIQVPGDASGFEISITPAAENQAKTIKASLSVKLPNGASLLPDLPVELKITPGSS